MTRWLRRQIGEAVLIKAMVIMLGLILVAAGCAPEEVAPLPVQPLPTEPPEVKPPEVQPHEIVNLEIYTSPAGTSPYSQALVIEGMLRELHPWLRATTLESLNALDAVVTTEFLPPARKKNVLLLTVGNNIALKEAHLGLGVFEKKYPNIKILSSQGMTGVAIATYDPEIRTPQDLVGKSIGFPPKGAPPAILAEALLKDAWGIYDKVQISEHRPPDVKDVLLSGAIDAAFVIAGSTFKEGEWILSSYVYEVAGARKTYWLDVTPEDIERIDQKNQWEPIPFTIPKEAYGEDLPPEDLDAVAFAGAWACWDVFDEEIAYELIKFLHDNSEEYTRRLPGEEISYGVPFYPGLTEEMVNPGALRYYKEQGIKIGV